MKTVPVYLPHRQFTKREARIYDEERKELQQVIGPDGRKLVAGFRSNLREARQNLRMAQPDLDAWLYFWGITDTFLSKQAELGYNDLVDQYMTRDMVE